MKKRKIDIFEALCLMLVLVCLTTAWSGPYNAVMTTALVFMVLAHGLHLIEEHRERMQYGDIEKDMTILKEKLKYTREEADLWRDKAEVNVALGGHMTRDGEFTLHDISMVKNPVDPMCKIQVTGKPGGPNRGGDMFGPLDVTGPSFVKEPADPAGRSIVDAHGAMLVHRKEPKPIYPEIIATHKVCMVDLNDPFDPLQKKRVRMDIDPSAYDNMTPDQLKKISEETAEFVNKIEEAHKDAAHSTLKFGKEEHHDEG